MITNNDKNKWDDLKWELRWTPDQLKQLISFRIARAFEPEAAEYSVKKNLDEFFQTRLMKFGHRKRFQRPVINHILDRTMLRPRDMISFFRECASLAIAREEGRPSHLTVRDCEEQYSIRLRQEIVDEIQSLLPDIDKILDVVGKIRLHKFQYGVFIEHLEAEADLNLAGLTVHKISNILFHFNVFGNVPRQEKERIFRYLNPRSKFSSNDQIIVHQGLTRSLELT